MSIFFELFLLQDKNLWFIKLLLALSNSKKKKKKKEERKKEKKEKKKQLQSLTLILWIPSARLSTRFENELVINFALLINFIL